TSPIAESGGFLSTQDGLSAPDIQLHFLPALVVDHGRTKMKKNGYSLHVCTLRPESTGTIRLKSTDPKEHPLIDANYLAERKDLDTLINGVKMGREILAQSGLDPYRAGEFQPGAGATRSRHTGQGLQDHRPIHGRRGHADRHRCAAAVPQSPDRGLHDAVGLRHLLADLPCDDGRRLRARVVLLAPRQRA